MARGRGKKRERVSGKRGIGHGPHGICGSGSWKTVSACPRDYSKTVPYLSQRNRWPSDSAQNVAEEDSDGSDEDNWQEEDDPLEEQFILQGLWQQTVGTLWKY